MSEIKMLPLPDIERYEVVGDIAYPINSDPNGDYVEYDGHVSAMADYARAVAEHNVKKRDAEIEALRALLLEACDDGDEADADLLATLERARTAEANVKALRAEVRDLRRRQAGWGRHIAAAGCEYVRDAEIEALRGEVDEHKRRANAYFQTAERQGKSAERLAEALRGLKDLMLGQVKWAPCDCGCPQQRTPDGPHSVTWLRAAQQVEIAIIKAEGKE